MSDESWESNAFIGIGLAGLGFFIALAAASATLGALAVPVWGMAIAIVAVIMRSPLARAMAERLGRKGSGAELPGELLAELDDLRARLLEIEERQDFAERLLTRGGTAHPVEEPRQ
ncbi:MAG TPA: hypothetical protein VFU00_05450 [Gemmatimonadales bacterium]|nr:hypothetical protein [Gemmatimonadales bacterium]